MRRFYFTSEILRAQGSQTFYVDADSEDKAREEYQRTGGEFFEEEVEVTSLGNGELSYSETITSVDTSKSDG